MNAQVGKRWKVGFKDGSGCGAYGECWITTDPETGDGSDIVVHGGRDSYGGPVGAEYEVALHIVTLHNGFLALAHQASVVEALR